MITREQLNRPNFDLLESRVLLSTYYVSTSGSDSAAGTSSAAAFQTLQHAADTARAGDTVNVAPGNYTGFEVTADGTASSPISFIAQPGVVINARARSTDIVVGIDLNHANYIVIDGFSLPCATFAGYIGIRSYGALSGQAVGDVLRNNSIDQAG
jgi:hypothetical protein